MSRDSTLRTFLVALLLCLACSFLVSATAVGLRERQDRNRADAVRRNILKAAFPTELGDGTDFDAFFQSRGVDDLSSFFDSFVIRQAIRLKTGDVAEKPDEYDQLKASRRPGTSSDLDLSELRELDVAGIKRREDVGWVYLVTAKGQPGKVETIILPIRGYGLWSTLYGFLAIDSDSLDRGPTQATVRGLTFYQHGETPGLGGEVDNPAWKTLWIGKRIFDDEWQVLLSVTKSAEDASLHDVDALSGATITSNGVSRMLDFWLGSNGYGPYLKRRASEHANPDRQPSPAAKGEADG